MKKIFGALIFCSCICNAAFAQRQIGIGLLPTVIHPIVLPETGYGYSGIDKVYPKIIPGFRGEFIKTRLGIGRVTFNYLGISLNAFPAFHDDISVSLRTLDGSASPLFTGKLKHAEYDGIVRVGFEIPLHLDEFLFFNFGFGGGINYAKARYDIPGFDPAKYYAPTTSGSLTEKHLGLLGSGFLSAFYELEKLYIFSQVELVQQTNVSATLYNSVRFSAGIYYKLNTSD